MVSVVSCKGLDQSLTFQLIHFLFIAVDLVLTAIFTFNILFLSLHAAMLIAFLIYIPAAFAFTSRRRKTRFDHAGGEVAYLVVQQIGWLCE